MQRRKSRPTFDPAVYKMLTASESHVESSLYPMRTHFPYFLWTPIKAEAESALIIRINAQGNKPSRATRGPG
jgi:hypothetical protein